MGVQFHANGHVRPDDGAHMLNQITFTVVITISHHGAVQTQHHAVQRQGSAQLAQHLVAQLLKSLARHQTGGLSPGTGAFDQRPALGPGPAPGHPKRCGAQLGILGVLAGRRIKRLMKALQSRWNRRKSVGLGTNRSSKQTHGGSPSWVNRAVFCHSDRFPKRPLLAGEGVCTELASSGLTSKRIANYPYLTRAGCRFHA